MLSRISLAFAAVALFAAGFSLSSFGQDKAKFTIKEVMEKAHKGEPPLCKKGVDGKLTKDEATQLVEYYKALSANKPPKGDPKSWEDKTKALVSAAELAAKEDKDYSAKYKAAVNCKACHEVHKGK
jgi:cytochrome c553